VSFVAGRLCVWSETIDDINPDKIDTYKDYFNGLQLKCGKGPAGILRWTPDEKTPNTVYYQVSAFFKWSVNNHGSIATELHQLQYGLSNNGGGQDRHVTSVGRADTVRLRDLAGQQRVVKGASIVQEHGTTTPAHQIYTVYVLDCMFIVCILIAVIHLFVHRLQLLLCPIYEWYYHSHTPYSNVTHVFEFFDSCARVGVAVLWCIDPVDGVLFVVNKLSRSNGGPAAGGRSLAR
jgi:hypothetical protein